jgi:4-diphosphocytidyl-2-C-methyl-D-erythritol kinase
MNNTAAEGGVEVSMNSITVKAYAKINLGLDVLRKREDGYHDVCMIMQSLSLHDTIIISRGKRKTDSPDSNKMNWQASSLVMNKQNPNVNSSDRNQSNEAEITIRTNLHYLPIDKGNLVYKAAALFLETISSKDSLFIKLEKRIPVAAGLAGGSSDAAATLKGLNKLYGNGLSQAELMKLGVKLGADVPYCIMLGTALSEGIGEVLTPLAPIPGCSILLVKPDISVSTRYVYENLRLTGDILHPDIEKMKAALAQNDLISLTRNMDNILQTVTIRDYPVITSIKDRMLELGALTSLMSGSGPTVFGVFQEKEQAEKEN